MAVVLPAAPEHEETGAGRSHVPLGERIGDGLQACRSLTGIECMDDERLRLLRRTSRADHMHEAAKALETAVAVLSDALRTPAGGARGARGRRMQDLRSELLSLRLEIERGFSEGHQEALRGVTDALHRLAGAESTKQLVERAAMEVCRSCGVDRCCIFRTDGAKLVVESVCFAADPAFQEEWEPYARAHPPQLAHQDREVQALRRRVAIMVDDPSELEGMREVIEAGRSSSYVAAPVVVRGSVVGLIHADRYSAGLAVDPVVRDTLATFAAGFGYALERNVLIDRTKSRLERMRKMIAEVEGSMQDLVYGGVSMRLEERGAADAGRHMPAVQVPSESRLGELLTRRELEVMELMSRGASNGSIADRLVISEGTVKSHVKHILRKLRAANRAQAVSTYVRIQSARTTG